MIVCPPPSLRGYFANILAFCPVNLGQCLAYVILIWCWNHLYYFLGAAVVGQVSHSREGTDNWWLTGLRNGTGGKKLVG